MGNEDIPDNKQGWIDPGPFGTGAFGAEFFRWMVYQDAKWSPQTFDLDRDYAAAVKRMGPIVDSHDPDLRTFTRHGGKLIVYHGWSDGRIPAEASIRYYDAVRRRIGSAAANKSVRLFMVPGMAHCSGGPGPDTFDMVRELDGWVAKGTPPERVIATKYDTPKVMMMMGAPGKALATRPLCAWPKTAHYIGKGSANDAANFVCWGDATESNRPAARRPLS
jgi:feruloyl esterase